MTSDCGAELLHSTIDTVSMQHLCRIPAIKVKIPREKAVLGLQAISSAIKRKRLLIYLDAQGGLKDEWSRTCGTEIVTQTLIQWLDLNGIHFCSASRSIQPAALNRTLKKYQFNDTCDKLIVRIGLSAISSKSAPEFWIATNDSDFWHPLDATQRGKLAAPVASALADHKLNPTLLKEFFLALL